MVLLSCCIFFLTAGTKKEDLQIDSAMSWDEAVKGTKAPGEILDSIVLLDVTYYSFDGKLHKGQILVNQAVSEDVEYFFQVCREEKFPIRQVIPIVKYGWDDDKSMEANNSSSFNYRKVAGSDKLSNHALGRAIDINPFLNPVYYNDGRISPKGAKYDTSKKGVFLKDGNIVRKMKEKGWRWGGDWQSLQDHHHFDKPQ